MSKIIASEDLYDILKQQQERLQRLERAVSPIIVHRIGISTALDPISPAFLNGWDNYQSGYNAGGNPQTIIPGWSPAVFYKDRGRVFLSGLIFTTVAPSSGPSLFILPNGYRPNNHHMFTVTGNSAPGRLDVEWTGPVINRSGNGFSGTVSGASFMSIECSFPHA